jgi:zinc transport system ATP-binding protein
MFAVDLENVWVKLGEYQALRGVTARIPDGAFVAIVGPNGAGKSTLLKGLLDLVKVQQGQIRVMGQAPGRVNPAQIGYVPQVKGFDRSFPAVALELVVSGLRRSWPFWMTAHEREQAYQALEQVGVAGLAQRPLGKLSGGELQRVFLARALARHPRLLLLDEPATGIDALGEADLYRNLESYQQTSGATVLMITHDWEAASHHASLVLLLNRKVITLAPPAQALTHDCLGQAFGHVGHAHAEPVVG